jgi:ABC-2 type transport system permease protein
MNARNAELFLGPARAIRRAAIVWALSLAAIVAATVSVWPAFKGNSGISQSMDQLPEGVVKAFGLAGFGTPAGFLRGNLYDFFVPLLMAGAAIGFANSLTSSEEDSGRMELVLTQPITRQAVFVGRVAAMFAHIVVITLVVAAVQFLSDAFFGLEIASDRLLATLILCGLLALFHAGLATAVASIEARPSWVLGVGLFVAIGGSIAAALLPLSPSLAAFAHISPWDWALSGDPLTNATDTWRYLALACPAVAMAAFGVWAFGRRDIAGA